MLCSVEDVRGEAAPIIAYAASFGANITDEQIARWIKESSAEGERLCRRTFAPKRQTEWYDGNDQTTLTVRRYPIIKVHKVRIWGGRHFLIWEFPEDKIVYEGKHTEEEYRNAELLVRSEIGELVITLGLLEWFQPLRMKPPLFIWNRRFLQGIQNIEVDYIPTVVKLKGKWILSLDAHSFVVELFKDYTQAREVRKIMLCSQRRWEAREMLFMNYAPRETQRARKGLFCKVGVFFII